MRFIYTIIIGISIICLEAYLGARTFFPELDHGQENFIDQIIEDKNPIINELSEAELSLINSNPIVTVGTDPHFYPLETFNERGQYTGLGSDYLRLINHLTGLELRAVREKDWASAELLAEEGKLDMFLAIAETNRRKNFLEFTKPYVFLPGMIVTRRSEHLQNLTIPDLNGKKVAVVENYFWHDYLVANHPELELVLTTNTLDALHLLASNNVDAIIDYEFNLMEKIQVGGFLQLQTAGMIKSVQGHAVAVRKDLPILFGIINKAMENISPSEHAAMAKQWLVAETENENKQMQWYFFFFTQALLVSIGVIIYANSKVEEALKNLQIKNKETLS